MPLEFNLGAAGALPLAGKIHVDLLVALNVQQPFSRRLMLLIHALQFEAVKPNSATASLADIHSDAANLRLSEFIEARWTFHNSLPH